MSDKVTEQAAKNTDREIWRRVPDDYYSPSIHVTVGGGIGMDVGGRVYVLPVEEWHRLAAASFKRVIALPSEPAAKPEPPLTPLGEQEQDEQTGSEEDFEFNRKWHLASSNRDSVFGRHQRGSEPVWTGNVGAWYETACYWRKECEVARDSAKHSKEGK